jgi:RNA polymerase sigma factor (sigma-70 family)
VKSLTPDLEALSDNSLMAKVRDGDLDRLGLLFERYKKPLYGFFYGMNRQQELCEDLVQNTFMRILKYRHLFRGETTGQLAGGDFRAWMYQIARNVNYDHHRGNKIKANEELEDWQDRLGHHENRANEMVQADNEQLLSMAMERLPMEKREVLLLSKFQEKKYQEIGEILGCSEGAVKVKVFRALQELKEVYKQLEKKM